MVFDVLREFFFDGEDVFCLRSPSLSGCFVCGVVLTGFHRYFCSARCKIAYYRSEQKE